MIVKPPAPAGVVSVTVPVEDVPLTTVFGLITSDSRVVGLIVKGADFELPRVAVMLAMVWDETDPVEMPNVPVLLPGAMVIEPGKLAAALSLVSVTLGSPTPAAPLSVTVPVAKLPPHTVDGEIAIERTVSGGKTVRVAVVDTP